MEAGYDYLLLRSRVQHRFIRASGILLTVTGAILLTAGIAYFIYAREARSNLDELNYTVPVSQAASETTLATTESSPTIQQETDLALPLPPAPQQAGDTLAELAQTGQEDPVLPTGAAEMPTQPEEASQSIQAPSIEETPPQISLEAIAAQQLYPGESIKSTFWSNPLEQEPASYIESSLVQGFKSYDPSMAATPGTLPAPTRITIPSIGVDSVVSGLKILDLGDSRAYETPKHMVGHIPEAANPGEMGSVWLFGHLESPIAGEGNVFYSLPKIPDLLRKGEDIYIIVENGTASYLYRIIETKVWHQDDMKMYDTGAPNIHLVSCVPRFVYDHRLVVTGELVGVRT